MDSVTQIALGAAVSGAVMGRRAGWRAYAWGAVVGTLPDLDSFVPFDSPVAAFTYHRSYTHSLFVQTLAAPLIAWGIHRAHRSRGDRYGRWTVAVWLALITHALLDAFTVYGTQLFLPFSDYPVGLGSIFIIDPLYTIPLGVGVIGALTVRRHAHRDAWWNGTGLAISTVYLAWTVVVQQQVESRAAVALAAEDLPASRVLATPTAFNTLLWRIVSVSPDGHWEGFHTVGSVSPIRFHRYDNRPGLLSGITDTWPVRRLEYFTKGFYAVNDRDDAVVISDLRMGQAGYYVFAFEVGERSGGATHAIPSRRYDYSRPPLTVVLRELLACGMGEPAERLAC